MRPHNPDVTRLQYGCVASSAASPHASTNGRMSLADDSDITSNLVQPLAPAWGAWPQPQCIRNVSKACGLTFTVDVQLEPSPDGNTPAIAPL